MTAAVDVQDVQDVHAVEQPVEDWGGQDFAACEDRGPVVCALSHQHICLEVSGDGLWSVFFNTLLLADLDERDRVLRD